MCGIGAYVGRIDESIEMKIKLLHALLSNRGEDGAGISYMDNEGKVSFSKDSGSSIKLIENYAFDVGGLNEACVTLHARKSSVGASSKENAHPFVFGHYNNTKKAKHKKNHEEKKYYKFSLVHNGTIKNWKELFNKHNTNNLSKDSDFTVDSKALGYILYHNWNKAPEILKDYVGGAALICSAENKLMLFRGESKENVHCKTVSEERPLYYCVTKNGIWAASEKNYLLTIRCNEKDIKEVPANKILIYDTNTYELLESIPVDRSNSLQNEYSSNHNTYGSYGNYGNYGNYGKYENSVDWSTPKPSQPKKPEKVAPKIKLTEEQKEEYSFISNVYWNSSYDNFVCYCSKNLESFVISEDGRLIMSTRDWISLTNDEKRVIKNNNMNLNTSIYYDLLDNYLVQDDFQKLSLIF